MNNSYLIGLTGNLGSGKSTVRRMLEQRGARGIDADALAHVVMERGTPTWQAVVEAFGQVILAFTGRIDRRKLAALVFADPAALARLEAIVHPAVDALVKQTVRDAPEPLIVVEAIKLIEAGMYRWCDATWVVTCAPQIMAERVTRDRQMTQAEINARLAAQGSVEDKRRLAQVVIDNSGSADYTLTQVVRAWSAIRNKPGRDKSAASPGPAAAAPAAAEPKTAEAPPPSAAAAEAPAAPAAAPAATALDKPAAAKAPASIGTAPEAQPMQAQKSRPAPAAKTPAKPSLAAIEVRRARRTDLEALSSAIAKLENRSSPMTRSEALRRLGDGGFRIAISGDRIVGLATWTAENLVATVREIWSESAEVTPVVLPKMLALVEDEARALFCEVILLLIDQSASTISAQARASGYERRPLNSLHPVWQSVVGDRLRPAEVIWFKPLREHVTTKPF